MNTNDGARSHLGAQIVHYCEIAPVCFKLTQSFIFNKKKTFCIFSNKKTSLNQLIDESVS